MSDSNPPRAPAPDERAASAGSAVALREHACPGCDWRGPLTGRCPACGRDGVVDVARLPPWLFARDRLEVSRGARTLVATVATLIGIAGAVSTSLALDALITARPAAAVLATTALGISLAALAGAILRRGPALLHRVARARRKRSAERRLARTAPATLSAAGDGRVRVRGRVVLEVPAFDPAGGVCAAFDRTADADILARHPIAESAGGIFALDDGSGALACVCAAHVVVLDGVRDGGRWIVPDGAVVEVAGRARRESAATDGGARGGPRTAARALIIEGCAAEPIVVRLVSESPSGMNLASAPGAAKVRVSLVVEDSELDRSRGAKPRVECAPHVTDELGVGAKHDLHTSRNERP